MRRYLVPVIILALVAALCLPAAAWAAGPVRVTGSGTLSSASGATAGLTVDAHGAYGVYPEGGSFSWTQNGVTRDYVCSSVTANSKGQASLYGTTSDGLYSMHLIVEDRKTGDIVRTGSGMTVVLWSVTSGDFRVK